MPPNQLVGLGGTQHRASPLGLGGGGLRFVDLDLLVEAVGDALQLVDGSIVLLNFDALRSSVAFFCSAVGFSPGFGATLVTASLRSS